MDSTDSVGEGRTCYCPAQASRKDAQRRGESGKGREHTGASSFAEESFSHPASWEKYEPFVKRKNPLLIATGGSIPLLCLEGVPDLPGAHQDEASLTTKFET